MTDTINISRCDYFERGFCKLGCFVRSRDYGMAPKYLGDGIMDYSECEVIKKVNNNKVKNYAF